VEGITLSDEIRTASPGMLGEILARFPSLEPKFIPHVEFKAQTATARAVVRSGEFTPYANVILTAGVVY